MVAAAGDSQEQMEEGWGGYESSHGGRVKDWYARNVMICEHSIAKALNMMNQKQATYRHWTKQ